MLQKHGLNSLHQAWILSLVSQRIGDSVNLNLIYFSFPALLYSAFGVVIEKTRGAEDDLNTIAAGTLTGMLYKSTGRVTKHF